MKILSRSTLNKNSLLKYCGESPEFGYAVESPQGVITVVDENEDIMDIFSRVSILYKIEEARKLISDMHRIWSDYTSDPYYKRGQIIYPLRSNSAKKSNLKKYEWENNIFLYRYKIAGEYIYGLCSGDKYIEAPMDGWERWLYDRERILKNRDRAIYGLDLGWEIL